MKRLVAILALLSLGAAPATTTAPATQSAPTKPAAPMELFDGGRVRLAPPPAEAGWRNTSRPPDGMSAKYELGDGNAVIVVVVSPQEGGLSDEMAPRMAQVIGQRVRESAKIEGAKLLYGPRVEDDGRFVLKVRDRQRSQSGQVSDRVQLYRQVGSALVHVVAAAFGQTEESSRRVHEVGEAMLLSGKIGSGPRPLSYRKTRVRWVVPPDWVEQRTDDPNGVVATYAAPDGGAARIIVRSKIIPKAARTDAGRKETVLDELLDLERNTPLAPGASMPKDEATYDDARFLRSRRRGIEIDGVERSSNVRCVEVGDVMLAFVLLAPPGVEAEAFQELSNLADDMALSARPLGERVASPAAKLPIRPTPSPSTARSP